MSSRITIVAATEKEIEPLLEYLQTHGERHQFQTYHLHGLQIDILYTGIGIMQTTYALMDYISHRHPDGWIQAGIGGSIDATLQIGDVVMIQSEMLVGFGAEDRDGRILDPFELGWADLNAFPYTQGRLEARYTSRLELRSASGMTTFHAHGYAPQIEVLKKQPHGQIENMEGASFFYVSLIRRIPFLSLRSVSNYVEPRQKENWNIPLAITNLNAMLIQWLETSHGHPDQLFIPLEG